MILLHRGYIPGFISVLLLFFTHSGLAADVSKCALPDKTNIAGPGEGSQPLFMETCGNSGDGQDRASESLKPEISGTEKSSQKKDGEKSGTEKNGSAEIDPEYVREFTPIESGHNDLNPVWSPGGDSIAFERNTGDKKEIIIARLDGAIIRTIYYRLDEGDKSIFFLPGIMEDISYNSGLSWSNKGDRFVFMSNGGSGNYDVYLYDLIGNSTTRLTDHKEKDGQAHWSPVGDSIVFVSGRTGKADIFLMDLKTRVLKQLTNGKKLYLYPQWSPDGKKIVMTYGSNENHDVYLIGDITRPAETLRALTTWTYDDLRPTWSPDGKKIAFYSNYNPENDPKVWSLMVISADGSDPTEGERLAAKAVAFDIIPDIEHGPSWMPDSSRIVYVKNDRLAYNPIFIVDIRDRSNRQVKTDTKMNLDVRCSSGGDIAFRTQVEQWDHIYVTKLKNSKGIEK